MEEKINRFPNAKAERFVDELIHDSEHWHIEKAETLSDPRETIGLLGPHTQRLFREFSYIEDRHSNFHIGHRFCNLTKKDQECVAIGRDMDSEFLVVPIGSDVVYRSSQEDKVDEDALSYTTIYHLILFCSVLFEDISLETVLADEDHSAVPESE